MNSMASTSSSHSQPFHLSRRLDLDAIRYLVIELNQYLHCFTSDRAARKSLQVKCSKFLSCSRHGNFEFSDHSVVSNLYWGIESIDAAILSDFDAERVSKLVSSEKMLQTPALLDEEESTAGVANRYIVCCSYFYLSIARKLQGDEWQMTMHMLQSLMVFPSWFRTQLAPGLWTNLFGFSGMSSADEIVRQQARRYKDWLMYYQVISFGETPPWSRQCSGERNCKMEGKEHQFTPCASLRRANSLQQTDRWRHCQNATLGFPSIANERMKRENKASISSCSEQQGFSKAANRCLSNWGVGSNGEINKERFNIRCLQEMLEESDSTVSFYSNVASEPSDSEATGQCKIYPANNMVAIDESSVSQRICEGQSPYSVCYEMFTSESPEYSFDLDVSETNRNYISSHKSSGQLNNKMISMFDMNEVESQPFCQDTLTGTKPASKSPKRDLRCFSKFSSKLRKKCSFSELVSRGSYTTKKKTFSTSEDWSDASSNCGESSAKELLARFEKALSTLCFSHAEVTIIWDFIKKKKSMRCSSTKQEILEELLEIIASSKAEKVVRASVSTLLLLISEDRTIIRYIKKDLYLYNLAKALKRNVHEAAILLYLLNPSPSEIRSLEVLPALVEVACSYNGQQKESILLPLTPTSASIAMIEVLVTAFDYVTNNIHLAAISSPQVLSKLVNVAMNNNLDEGVALAAILIRCMRLNENCKKFLSQVTPLDPFLQLLRSNEKHAKFAALEYFHEILIMPRSSAINMLHQIRQMGNTSVMQSLLACIKQTEPEHRVLAANILLQLDILETEKGKSVLKEEAMKAIMEIVSTEKNTTAQSLASHILSNLGGTYSWMGEPYTVPWLLKKAGLTSMKHRNMLKNIDWFDTCLQDPEISSWSANAAHGMVRMGRSIFDALAKGIKSTNKSVSHDCLICIAWLGTELATTGANNLRYYACELLLSEIAQFLHPGSDLDERILSCLCIYNYTSGKGKQKLIEFSESMRESLRRLSGLTWMAEELLKVTDFFLPSKPRVSCVHTQILEISPSQNGAVTALIFYKGLLTVGHSDGSLKVWDIKEQRGMLLWELKEHKKAITCLVLSTTGDNILSASVDKTVRVWKMVRKKLECVEVLDMKEPVQKIYHHGNKILFVTQNRRLKLWHSSNNINTLCKNKNVTSFVVTNDKVYLGCSDSSIQEVDVEENNKTEIRTPAKTWRKPSKPINSLVQYKDWLYSAGGVVEGASLKDWKRRRQPHISVPVRSSTIQAMEVVEDFVYLNTTTSQNTVQIWLRGQLQKVGRISTGSKITSLLTANDIIFCGTECGSIKGWIPL